MDDNTPQHAPKNGWYYHPELLSLHWFVGDAPRSSCNRWNFSTAHVFVKPLSKHQMRRRCTRCLPYVPRGQD